MTKKVDCIIVGFGLAGSVLAYKLSKKGYKLLIIDLDEENTSSKIAGGMWNPIVFKRINKCWNADETFPVAMNSYQEIQELINIRILNYFDVIRTFPNWEYANDYKMKSHQPGFDKLLSTEKIESFEKRFNPEFGYGVVKGTGWLNIKLMIQRLTKYFVERNEFIVSDFDDSELILEEKGITWKNYTSDKLVFCRGHKETEGKYFSNIPLKKSKGEVLDIKTKNPNLSYILNNTKFITPHGEYECRTGSTYDQHYEDNEPTEEGKERILEKSRLFFDGEFEVVGHKSGIRPTVKDRRPIIGPHPNHDNLFILNGMGTRGVLNTPFCVEELIDHMETGGKIMKDIDIGRFGKIF